MHILVLSLQFLWIIVSLSACISLPPLEERSVSFALSKEETSQTTLARILSSSIEKHSHQSGIVLLSSAQDAFASRVLMIRNAEKTLDVQYYIWRKDITGMLLLRELYHAAERGVRVRILLDDNGITGMDKILSMLNAHDNIEVRIFNPFRTRILKSLDYLSDFSRINRRMHNKSLTADNTVTIVGGRNIGDEYFGALDGKLFADLDVMAIGEIVPKVGQDFDRYWNSQFSYPIDLLVYRYSKKEQQKFFARTLDIEKGVESLKYRQAIDEGLIHNPLLNQERYFEWVDITLLSDPPQKVSVQAEHAELLINDFDKLNIIPKKSIDLISPYFILTQNGIDYFRELNDEGVKIRILTNSLKATDVSIVHAGYMKSRQALLGSGIEIYELRPQLNPQGKKIKTRFLTHSGSSLHAKTFVIDQQYVFIGSFNFDPRSAKLNTEMGFLINSPQLGQFITHSLTENLSDYAYQVRLTENNKIHWIDCSQQEKKEYKAEPEASMMKRLWIKILSLLPVDDLL